ncbi:homoserine kinase [Alkalihalophilus marmarensis]|uniref:homoserine kinase n=1 Tax=Alkalihalophilus marmarensis TaxID=521377 RepID=UPI002040893E|nr:homoserine kinase [Alkalihalophilus marmarensis]
MSVEPFMITVPGSTANLGPGFDSVGLAVDRYLTLVAKPADAWSFYSESPDLKGVPADEENLIYKVAKHVADTYGYMLTPCEVEMTSDIPLTRGLGSSAAAIVAGIELANQQMNNILSPEEKVRLSSLWEGHPDNVAASVYGGLVIGTHTEDATHVLYGGVPEVDLVVVIPKHELLTKKARGVLPESLPYKKAVRGSGVANVLVAALLQGNFSLAGEMMSADIFHHPYRGELVPHLQDVIDVVREDTDAYGAALSGAGPTIFCLAPLHSGETVKEVLSKRFPDFEIDVLAPAKRGVCVKVPRYLREA